MASFMDYNDEESELGESDRRKKSVYRYFDFGDDEDDDFNRRKKSLYMLPRMSWSPYDKKGNFKLLISTYKSASLLISSWDLLNQSVNLIISF